MLLNIRCAEHKKYKGKTMATKNCAACFAIWMLKHHGQYFVSDKAITQHLEIVKKP